MVSSARRRKGGNEGRSRSSSSAFFCLLSLRTASKAKTATARAPLCSVRPLVRPMPMPQTDSRQIYGGKRREERLGGGKKWRRDHRLMVFPAFLCPPPSFCNSCSVLESEKNKQTQIERMVQKLVSKCRRFHCCTAVNSNRPSVLPIAHYDRMPKM